MNRSLWWRFLAISLVFSLLVMGSYLVLVRETTRHAREAIQRSICLFIARALESGPYAESMPRLDALLAESPDMPRGVWVVSGDGRLLASRSGDAPPADWLRIDRPREVHEVRTLSRVAQPALALVRLDDVATSYLVVSSQGLAGRPIRRLLGLFFVATLAGAVFLGLTLVTLYLRGRSREARLVIARLESGDLRARFQPEPLDALGVLMLDFNRMADEIERLVHRLQAADAARRQLLQELGHDLRTPLTSLRTSVEAVAAHGDSMPRADRDAFLAIIQGELDYFVRLIDDLFFIADMAEPRYRQATERVDLAALLASEIDALHSRRGTNEGGRKLRCTLAGDLPPPGEREVAGDPLLLARLLRNALDNAARHARQDVRASLRRRGDALEIVVEDDGPGMSASDIAAFGRRRTQRLQAGAALPFMSLGLGSVIMKTIVDLHGGRLQLESGAAGEALPGTRLTMSLPRRAPPEPGKAAS